MYPSIHTNSIATAMQNFEANGNRDEREQFRRVELIRDKFGMRQPKLGNTWHLSVAPKAAHLCATIVLWPGLKRLSACEETPLSSRILST